MTGVTNLPHVTLVLRLLAVFYDQTQQLYTHLRPGVSILQQLYTHLRPDVSILLHDLSKMAGNRVSSPVIYYTI